MIDFLLLLNVLLWCIKSNKNLESSTPCSLLNLIINTSAVRTDVSRMYKTHNKFSNFMIIKSAK